MSFPAAAPKEGLNVSVSVACDIYIHKEGATSDVPMLQRYIHVTCQRFRVGVSLLLLFALGVFLPPLFFALGVCLDGASSWTVLRLQT